jgi:flagellin-like hook-associated protein FlgL
VNTQLGSSLEKLSSGVRINKAADDASGMAIANSLKSQSSSLSQAIRNANDAIGLVQIADNAMQEMSNILNTIKTKSIQSAQDGQTTTTRLAIQKDINRLLEGLDNIAKTTSYNGQNLLSGAFANKEIQVGAYSNETVQLSINATDGEHIGHVRRETFDMTHLNGDQTLEIGKEISLNIDGKGVHTSVMDIVAGTGVGQMANLINSNSDILGVRASYHVETISSGPIEAGNLANLTINGINLGNITDVMRNDQDGKLVNAINEKSHLTGVVANVDENGQLHLNSADGRGILMQNYGAVIPTAVTSQTQPWLDGQTAPDGSTYDVEGFVLPTTAPTGGEVLINGIDILDKDQAGTMAAVTEMDTLAEIATLINMQQHLTNVSANVVTMDDGSQQLQLTGNIESISGFNDPTPAAGAFTGFALGIRDIDPTSTDNNLNGNLNFGTLTLLGAGANDIMTEFGTNTEVGTTVVAAPAAAVTANQVLINGVDVIGAQATANVTTTAQLVALINTHINQTNVIASEDAAGNLVLDGDIKSLTGFNEGVTGFGVNAGIADIQLQNEQPSSTEIKNLASLVKENMLLSQSSSMVAMDIVDASLSTLDTIRSDIGSVQNQLNSTIANITVTQANIQIAESGIRDVDFAAESADFNKNKLLAQAGTFALSQANTVQQNVMKLLQ